MTTGGVGSPAPGAEADIHAQDTDINAKPIAPTHAENAPEAESNSSTMTTIAVPEIAKE